MNILICPNIPYLLHISLYLLDSQICYPAQCLFEYENPFLHFVSKFTWKPSSSCAFWTGWAFHFRMVVTHSQPILFSPGPAPRPGRVMVLASPHEKSEEKDQCQKVTFYAKIWTKEPYWVLAKKCLFVGFFFTGFKRCNHFKKLNLVPQTIYIYVTHDPNFNIYIKLWHTQIKFGNFFFTNAVFKLMVLVINAFLKSCHPFLFFFFA